VLNRIQTFELRPGTFPKPLQHGFEKGLCCLSASYCLLETIYHNIEENSKVFVAFLDSRTVFDTVWRKSLMFKLFNLGKVWSCINEIDSYTQSAVIVNKCKSKYFEVNEGVRQGGVLSGFLYLIFINELINELGNCNEVTWVNSIKCCAPSLADYITCISKHQEDYSECLIFAQTMPTSGGFSSMEWNPVWFNFQNPRLINRILTRQYIRNQYQLRIVTPI
jgi:hypothetical protein